MIHPEGKKRIMTTDSKRDPTKGIKWKRLWRSTGTSSPHPQGYLNTFKSNAPLIFTPSTPLPTGLIYRHYILENDEMKRKIHGLL